MKTSRDNDPTTVKTSGNNRDRVTNTEQQQTTVYLTGVFNWCIQLDTNAFNWEVRRSQANRCGWVERFEDILEFSDVSTHTLTPQTKTHTQTFELYNRGRASAVPLADFDLVLRKRKSSAALNTISAEAALRRCTNRGASLFQSRCFGPAVSVFLSFSLPLFQSPSLSVTGLEQATKWRTRRELLCVCAVRCTSARCTGARSRGVTVPLTVPLTVHVSVRLACVLVMCSRFADKVGGSLQSARGALFPASFGLCAVRTHQQSNQTLCTWPNTLFAQSKVYAQKVYSPKCSLESLCSKVYAQKVYDLKCTPATIRSIRTLRAKTFHLK